MHIPTGNKHWSKSTEEQPKEENGWSNLKWGEYGELVSGDQSVIEKWSETLRTGEDY